MARPRLTDKLASAPVGVVVAGGGYGKSVLIEELSDALGIPTITAVLDQEPTSAALVMGRMRSSAASLGLSDVVARMDQAAPDEPNAQLMGLFEALAGQPALFAVDEIHCADADAIGLLVKAARGLREDHRLLVVGRRMPSGLESILDVQGSVALGITDLALTADELTEIARSGFDVTLSPTQTFDVLGATGGWLAAALLLLGGSTVGSGVPVANLAVRTPAALNEVLDQILNRLPVEHQEALIQVAHLPILDERAVAAATDVVELLYTARAAGLPMTEASDGTKQLIGPVQDALRARAPISPQTIDRAAGDLTSRQEFVLAARLRLDGGQPVRAAQVLSGLTSRQAEEIPIAEFAVLAELLPDTALARSPRVLLHLARACELGAMTRLRSAVLRRAEQLIDPIREPALGRELIAERARDLVWSDHFDDADTLAKSALAETRLDEELTRARLLDVLGRVAAVQRDDLHLSQAEERLHIAANTYRAHGQWTWLAQLQMMTAIWVQAARGAFGDALQSLDDALSAVPNERRLRCLILTFRAELLDEIGRHDEATESLIEAEDIAVSVSDPRLLAYVAWDRARQASLIGDRDGLLPALAAAEANVADWFDQSGCMFLAEAADSCDRVGLTQEADAYLARAHDHPLQDETAMVRAQAAVAARHGDPQVAERYIQRMVAAPWFETRDIWYAALLRAYIAARRGDVHSAVQFAAKAFGAASELGYPQLPFVREREITEELLTIAAGDRELVHVGAVHDQFPVMVGLLGGFRLNRAGRPIEVPPGQGRQLLKLVAIAGGTIVTDQVIEHLWPEVDPTVGANRLRTVLNRLRDSASELVERGESTLRLAPHVRIDTARFEHNAGRAESLAAVRSSEALAVARTALAIYRGDLLPEDQYEPWTEVARERLRRHAVSLLDICAKAAAEVGDLDEAVRCLDRACELEPYEEVRYLTAARHLLAQGRRGVAGRYVDRARVVITELALAPSPLLTTLERLTARLP